MGLLRKPVSGSRQPTWKAEPLAIYSCNHKPVGRTTHAAGTAGAAVRYITRVSAATQILGEHMPLERNAARAWIDQQEQAGRKNARICDKLLVALPIEFDAAQRADLVREFVHEIGGGQVSWLAAVHDRGRDAHNPHAHIILRDKDHASGKRVYGTSEKGSTERLRELWERVANRALERAGIEARIDCRSLAEQGIAREAGIHVGPNVVAMEERGLRPVSMAQEVERPGQEPRVVNWPEIDQGRTRADRQREIEGRNAEREREKKRGKGDNPQLKPRQQAAREAEAVSGRPTTPEQPEAIQRPENRPSGRIPEPEPIRPRDPAEERAAWAARLRALAQPPQEPKQAPRQAEPSPTREAPRPPEPLRPRPDAERVSRLREMLDIARSKLSALGHRLDAAFQRVRERSQAPEVKPQRDRGKTIAKAMEEWRRSREPERPPPTPQPERRRSVAEEMLERAQLRREAERAAETPAMREVREQRERELSRSRGRERGMSRCHDQPKPDIWNFDLQRKVYNWHHQKIKL